MAGQIYFTYIYAFGISAKRHLLVHLYPWNQGLGTVSSMLYYCTRINRLYQPPHIVCVSSMLTHVVCVTVEKTYGPINKISVLTAATKNRTRGPDG